MNKIKITESQLKMILKETQDVEEISYQDFQERNDLQDLRDALDKNKTVSVAFVKKDGTVRHMAIRSNLSSYVGSDREKTEKQQNVEMNNNLKKVIDINSYIKTLKTLRQDPNIDEVSAKQQAAKGAWRSINLENVLGFLVSGKFKDLRDENNILERYGQEIYNQLTKSMVRAMDAELQNQEQEIQNVDQENPQQ